MSDQEAATAEFGTITPGEEGVSEEVSRRSLNMLYDLTVKVSVELGQTSLTIRDLLNIGPGSVVELDRLAGETIDLLVNGMLIGKGEVVVVNDNFGLRITDIVSSEERLEKI